MRPSTPLLAAMAAMLALGLVGATPETTCRAAADSDTRVDYRFCVSKLSNHHDSHDADTWGLAKVAANVGVRIAGNVLSDVKGMLRRAPRGGHRQALEQCEQMYHGATNAFAEAYDAINRRDYETGKAKAQKAGTFARRCRDAFEHVPSPLVRQLKDSVQIAIVCTAVTKLI